MSVEAMNISSGVLTRDFKRRGVFQSPKAYRSPLLFGLILKSFLHRSVTLLRRSKLKGH